MKFKEMLIFWLIYPLIYLISLLPFLVLHRFSELLYLGMYYLGRYRRKVVSENLLRSFPEKTDAEIKAIEKKFYLNFCDLIFETIKTFSISPTELKKRNRFLSSELMDELYQKRTNLLGISGHLGNWEWLSLNFALQSEHVCYGVYKPLSNPGLNLAVKKTRARTGMKMVAIQELRDIFKLNYFDCMAIGLLSDQAPHDYEKAIQVQFLNQKTHVVAGPGVISVQRGFLPTFVWIKRVGRSRYEWGFEVIEVVPPSSLSADDLSQMERIARVHSLTDTQAGYELELTKQFTQKIEVKIKMAPQDWLWSHRRWKLR